MFLQENCPPQSLFRILNQRFDYMNFRHLYIVFLGLALFTACESGSSSANVQDEGGSNGNIALPQGAESPLDQRSRGLDGANARLAQDFSFQAKFPTLTRVLQGEDDILKELDVFARKTLISGQINSEASLISTLETRDSVLIPRVEAALQTKDNGNTLNDDYNALQDELEQLGMQMTFAEGMFTSIGPAPFLQAEMDRYASKAFRLFCQFQDAKTRSYNGEYPFLDMSPYAEMVQVGEELMGLEANPYQARIKETFQSSVLYMSDVHKVNDPTARGQASFFVNGISTDAYPYLTENQSREAFITETEGSAFQKSLSKIMANPSSMSPKPEHLYLVIVEWATTAEMAKTRVSTHLLAGEDVPHYLEVNLADGTKKFAVVYRFFENAEKAESALLTAQADFPKADLMMVSVQGEALYQIGG